MAKADEEMKSLVPTNVLHKQADGTYTAERQQLHVEILEKLFTNEAVIAATPPSGTQPTLVLTGGRPAAGKTSSYLRDQRVDGFYISADTIQEHLPGYRGDHAGLFNGEGHDIAAQAEAMARSMRLNIVYDATLKSTQPAVDRVEQYQSDGYQVDLHFTHTAPAVSAQRSVSRFMNSGRYVPPIVSYNSRTNEKTFDTLRPKVDRWWLYDNNGEFPAKIADGGPRLHKD